MDDLGAIIVIAVFYTQGVSLAYLASAVIVFGILLLMNRLMHIAKLAPYLAGGALMWFLMLQSGVHATIAGVLLAFAIPYSAKQDDTQSPSHRLESVLHTPVGYIILPIFALANTGVVIGMDWAHELGSNNSLGIVAGLALGKPLGITIASLVAVSLGICRLPYDLSWRHVFGAGLLGGIGFTMSIFITNLAFPGQPGVINDSKIAILAASLTAGALGFAWLRIFGKPLPNDCNLDTMDVDTDPNHHSVRFPENR